MCFNLVRIRGVKHKALGLSVSGWVTRFPGSLAREGLSSELQGRRRILRFGFKV